MIPESLSSWEIPVFDELLCCVTLLLSNHVVVFVLVFEHFFAMLLCLMPCYLHRKYLEMGTCEGDSQIVMEEIEMRDPSR